MAAFSQTQKSPALQTLATRALPAGGAVTIQSAALRPTQITQVSASMSPATQASASASVQPANLSTAPGAGSTVLSGKETRPLWFNGRFLAASDLRREQHYFLRKQANLGRAGGYGVIHGLAVVPPAPGSGFDPAETIVVSAGVGITPSGELVMISSDLTIELSDLADEENLNEQFGLAETPQQPSRTRTGVYVIALRPVQFTANPIASYPSTLQTPRVTQDGDIVEATAVSLIPFANPVNNYDTAVQRAALARQIFVLGSGPTLPSSLLPLAMVGIDRNVLQWIDMYLVRRDSAPQASSIRLGLADPATQQAFLMQYDAQLQNVMAARGSSGLDNNFAASDYFQALPPVGRFPLGAIDTANLTQQYFPQQMPVTLSLIPQDELPAVIQDSLSLSPVDLTMSATSFANFSGFALLPVDRASFADQLTSLQQSLSQNQQNYPTTLNPVLPQTVQSLGPLRPIGPIWPVPLNPTPLPAAGNGWQTVFAGLPSGFSYGFYVLRRSQPIYVNLTNPTVPPATTTPTPAATTSAKTLAPATTGPGTTVANRSAQVPAKPSVRAILARTTPAPRAQRKSTTPPAPVTTPNPNIAKILQAPATNAPSPRKTRPAQSGRKSRT